MHPMSKTLFALAVAFGVSGAAGASAQSTSNTSTPATSKAPASAAQADKKPVAHSAHKTEAPSEAGLNKPATPHKTAQPGAAKPVANEQPQPSSAVHAGSKNKTHAQPAKAPSDGAVKGSSK